MRAFAKVKSSAIMSRQPSVPNLIAVIRDRGKYTRSDISAKQPHWTETAGNPLQQFGELSLFERLYDFGDVLRAVAGDDQKRVGSFYDNEVADADGGDEFRRAVEKIAGGIESQAVTGHDVVAGVFCEEFVDRGPGADVAPADVGGDDVYLRRAFLARRVFEDCIVDGNVFQSRIYGAQAALVGFLADGFSQRFESFMRFGKKALQVVEKRRDAPEKHACVPLIVARSDVLFRKIERGLLREAPHSECGKVARAQSVAHALDVAEAGVRPSRRNAENYHAPRLARPFECRADDFAIFVRLRDEVVGRHHGHQRIAFCGVPHVERGQRDGSGRVAANGFGQNAFAGRDGELFSYGGGLLGVRDAPDAVSRN